MDRDLPWKYVVCWLIINYFIVLIVNQEIWLLLPNEASRANEDIATKRKIKQLLYTRTEQFLIFSFLIYINIVFIFLKLF